MDLGHLIALGPIAHREEGADVAVARQFEVGLLLLEHPPQGLWSLHLVPQHPRIHPDVSGRALERRAGCGESTLEAFGRRPQCSWHRPWWAVIRNPYMSGTLSRPFSHSGASRFLSCFVAFFCSTAPQAFGVRHG